MTKVCALAEMTWLTTDAIFLLTEAPDVIKARGCWDCLCNPASAWDTPPSLTLLELTNVRLPPPR